MYIYIYVYIYIYTCIYVPFWLLWDIRWSFHSEICEGPNFLVVLMYIIFEKGVQANQLVCENVLEGKSFIKPIRIGQLVNLNAFSYANNIPCKLFHHFINTI